MAKKTYVFDTSVILTDCDSVNTFENNDIIIPLKVLDEIDKHKQRQDTVGSNARKFIRFLDALRLKGNLHGGVRIMKGKGMLRVMTPDLSLLPPGMDPAIPDNQIIATALTEKMRCARQANQGRKTTRKVIMVSRDINMRVKCDSIDLLSEEYIPSQVVKSRTDLYTGFTSYLIDDQIIDRFHNGDDIFLDGDDIKLYPNQFILLVSSLNDKKTGIARFVDYDQPLLKVTECNNNSKKKKDAWGIKTRNKEQGFVMNLLNNPNIDLVTIVGKAGTGKTLLATAAGLQQVLSPAADSPGYKHLIVSRPIQPMGKDIGYLPGTMEEKMMPWLAPIQDNLKYLLGNNKDTLKMYISQGVIEIEALTYIRGRSIANAFIIIDEAQNLTIHELKTIITRAGENTKIVLTGDIEQIDNVYIDETSNGLAYAVEKFKDHSISGHVTLTKGERSKIATLAAKIL